MQVHRLWFGYLKGDLSQEDELVPLEEPTCRVHVHRVGDLVRQIHHSLLHLVGWRRLLDGFFKHHIEGLGNGQCEHGAAADADAASGSF